ncbi:DUF397 domain-containing protein [Actinopolyspora erythraea]|uniref:DUF397 domain-containing protein n=1 Tax=Actinopolyspora erythraea TaxID=414996 RepID=A0A099D0Q0_9ACTN|nr:DUF397 domain-containing protein [Actinopolyspora erythraea]ASU79793.1 DUF397 domain-containing protein [Actinopolyspora erythraea]KGI79584.1 regulator [Actinopolyspora erythraea]
MIPTENFGGWHKATASAANGGGCVEVGYAPGHIAVRDSKDRTQGAHVFTAEEWTAFLAGVKAGEFDL